jgi:hypothetical protein
LTVAVTRYAIIDDEGQLVHSGFPTSADADSHRDRVRKKDGKQKAAAQYTTVSYSARS